MKRQSIFFILLLLQVLFIISGCGSSDKSSESPTAAAEEASVEEATHAENAEDVVGIFEGLEDNHTAIFSFEGAEKAFYFEDSAVQQVLYEAVLGSHYTLSYSYDSSLGYVIYEISE